MLLKSFSTPGRSIGRAAGPNIADRAQQLLADAQGQAMPVRGGYSPAEALRAQVQQQVGQSGVDLAEHAALRQAAALANNAEMGKAADYGPEPRQVDPRLTVQFRNEMARRALTPTDILARSRRNPLDVLG